MVTLILRLLCFLSRILTDKITMTNFGALFQILNYLTLCGFSMTRVLSPELVLLQAYFALYRTEKDYILIDDFFGNRLFSIQKWPLRTGSYADVMNCYCRLHSRNYSSGFIDIVII